MLAWREWSLRALIILAVVACVFRLAAYEERTCAMRGGTMEGGCAEMKDPGP